MNSHLTVELAQPFCMSFDPWVWRARICDYHRHFGHKPVRWFYPMKSCMNAKKYCTSITYTPKDFKITCPVTSCSQMRNVAEEMPQARTKILKRGIRNNFHEPLTTTIDMCLVHQNFLLRGSRYESRLSVLSTGFGNMDL